MVNTIFSIGEVSKRTGIKVPTLRFYESETLISEPTRSEGGQRRYSQQHVEQLLFIKHARQLGFALADVRALLEIGNSEENNCEQIHTITDKQLLTINAKLELLQSLKSELERIAKGCEAGHVGYCYVIESLANHELCSTEH